MKKAAMRANITSNGGSTTIIEPANIPQEQPQINYELTIHCLVCNYKHAKGGLDAQANLSKTEVLTLAMHNPRCKIGKNCECVASVCSDVERTDSTNVTHYYIELV